MKRYLTLIGLAIGLALPTNFFTGCMSVDPNTGEKVFDPVKTDLLVSSIEDGLSEVVFWTAKADPNTASAFRIIHSILNQMVVEGEKVDRDEIQRRLAGIKIDGMSDEDSAALIRRVSDIVLGKWDIIVNAYLRVGVNETNAWAIGINTVRNAIFRGLLMNN